jgi:cytochrome P450
MSIVTSCKKKVELSLEGSYDNLYSFVLFTGGFETTANALTFMCFLLAKHQDVQDKLYQEISENIEVIESDLMSR